MTKHEQLAKAVKDAQAVLGKEKTDARERIKAARADVRAALTALTAGVLEEEVREIPAPKK